MAASAHSVTEIPFSILRELKIPLFVVDGTGALSYASPTADSITEGRALFRTVRNVLVADDPSDNVQLNIAIANACAKGKRGTFAISDDGSGKLAFVSVVPFRNRDNRDSKALVIVQRSNVDEENYAHAMRQMFRLSPAECSVAKALADGTAVEHIAKIRVAKVATVRAQIAVIMLKTGTHRQAKLVALLSRIASLHEIA